LARKKSFRSQSRFLRNRLSFAGQEVSITRGKETRPEISPPGSNSISPTAFCREKEKGTEGKEGTNMEKKENQPSNRSEEKERRALLWEETPCGEGEVSGRSSKRERPVLHV